MMQYEIIKMNEMDVYYWYKKPSGIIILDKNKNKVIGQSL